MFEGKEGGLIVGYIGIGQNLKEVLLEQDFVNSHEKPKWQLNKCNNSALVAWFKTERHAKLERNLLFLFYCANAGGSC